MRHETAERNGKEFMLVNENWQNDWAPTTLSVIKGVALKEGRRLYPHDSLQRDDLQSFLTVEAQRLANHYKPNPKARDPEKYWAGALTSALRIISNRHWGTWVGVSTNNPSYEKASAASQPWARIEHMLNKDSQKMAVQGRMAGLTGQRALNPEDHYIRVETLQQQLNNLTNQEAPKAGLCIEEECNKPVRGQQTRCAYHAGKHKELWAEGTRCSTIQCVDAAVVRGWCMTHYQRHYQRAQREGRTWDKTPTQTDCSVKDCPNPHSALSLCKTHYGTYRQSLKPPCTERGCDRNQLSKGLCQKHYDQQRRSKL